jgi:hypothetical protein
VKFLDVLQMLSVQVRLATTRPTRNPPVDTGKTEASAVPDADTKSRLCPTSA